MKVMYVVLAAGCIAAALAVGVPGGTVPDHFEVNATYADGHIHVIFQDTTGGTSQVSMEIQGMAETFRRTYDSHEFIDMIQYGPPRYGWAAHPVLLDIRHDTLGDITIKTEIRDIGQPPAPVLLVK